MSQYRWLTRPPPPPWPGISRKNETDYNICSSLTSYLEHPKTSFHCVRKSCLVYNNKHLAHWKLDLRCPKLFYKWCSVSFFLSIPVHKETVIKTLSTCQTIIVISSPSGEEDTARSYFIYCIRFLHLDLWKQSLQNRGPINIQRIVYSTRRMRRIYSYLQSLILRFFYEVVFI